MQLLVSLINTMFFHSLAKPVNLLKTPSTLLLIGRHVFNEVRVP
jgi:hypothetical protein